MLKKKVLVRKTSTQNKKVSSIAISDKRKLTQSVSLEVLTFSDKPNIEDVIKAFDLFNRKRSAAKLCNFRSSNSEKLSRELREAKKLLFKEFLALGLSKHLDWK